jgi:glycosyltransferase involved in cell wall biosynthesis
MKTPSLQSAGDQPATILFLDHTAKLGGGEINLFNLLLHIDKVRFKPLVVLGEDGALADKMRKVGIETYILPLPDYVANTRKDSIGAASLLKIRLIGAVLAYSWRLAALIKSSGASLVHTNSLKADIIGGIAGKITRTPVVWHIRDRIEIDYLPAPVTFVFRWLCRVVPSFIVANSNATLATLHLPGGAPQAVVNSSHPSITATSAIVPEGIPQRNPVSKSHPEKILIGLVGRITRWKGQHIFLKAAALVRSRFPSVNFQIIGSAMFGEEAYEREIHAMAKSLALDGCVEFMGFRNDVPKLMAEFDILVHASTTGEPFGQVITEAMIVGKPVVATRGGGVPEIVQEGVTGLLVPMGDATAMADAICELLSDPRRAKEMGLAGRTRVLKYFTVDVSARRIASIYRKLLNRGDSSPLDAEFQGTAVSGTC